MIIQTIFWLIITRGTPKNPEFIYKKLCIYSNMFKPVTFKVLPIWCNMPTETVFHCSKQFLNLSILMPFSAPAVFCSTSSTLAKCFIGGKEKSCLGRDWVNREGRALGSGWFWSKTAEHSSVWAGALVNHPSWKGQMCWKSLQKKFTEAQHSL